MLAWTYWSVSVVIKEGFLLDLIKLSLVHFNIFIVICYATGRLDTKDVALCWAEGLNLDHSIGSQLAYFQCKTVHVLSFD